MKLLNILSTTARADMPESFEVNEYWLNRGRTYINEERLAEPYHRLQEQFLFNIIRDGQLPTGKIIELGCGFGRITKLLAKHFPESEITALDLSPDQLNNAKAYCRDQQNITFESYDFYSGAPLPGNNYDLGVAIEVFLHHRAHTVSNLIAKLSQGCKYILNLDWSEPWPWATPEHVWVHDYEQLYHETGLKCASVLLPEKLDGKQQKIFIAARHLPTALLKLEQQLRQPVAKFAEPAKDWLQQLHCTQTEIKTFLPPGSRCILVDENHWGDAREKLRMLPFLERNGQYWGLPLDDAQAIRELERMRVAGAEYLVFPWHSFWWLDHYRDFRDRLYSEFRCIAETDHLIVFKLN